MKTSLRILFALFIAWSFSGCVTDGAGDPCYTVNYDLNAMDAQGDAPEDPNRYVSGRTVTVLATTATLNGYSFTGWNTRPDAGGTSYQPGDTFNITKDVTLYAIWEQATYRVTYFKNPPLSAPGINDESIYFDVPYGEEHTILTGLLGGFSIPNHIFVEWNTARNGYGMAISGGMSYVFDEDITLYAIWMRDR